MGLGPLVENELYIPHYFRKGVGLDIGLKLTRKNHWPLTSCHEQHNDSMKKTLHIFNCLLFEW